MTFEAPRPKSVTLTANEARDALSRCSKAELALMKGMSPREINFVLEAKLFLGATLKEGGVE